MEIVAAAVGEATGTVDFQSCEQGAYSGVLVGAPPGKVRTIAVAQTTLDTLVSEPGRRPPDVLKMDIEGSELLALRGGTALFEGARPILLAEFSDRRTRPFGYRAVDAYDWLSEREYMLFRFTSGSRLIRDERRNDYDADNLVGCPAEALNRLRPWLLA